ncbi:MAG: response regulator [Christensenellaceae bacterium]|nr:response regulator [Christensenellaceae bacterium]
MNKDKKKILVVDDIEINRIVLSDLFSDKFDVLEAENGEMALKALETHRHDISIILLDLVMPVMDGFEVLRRLNADGTIKNIPIILITSDNDEENTLMAYGLGVSDFIRKPFNPDIVLKRVYNTIDLYSYKNYLEQKLIEQREELEKQNERIKQFNLFIMDALSTTVEFRSLESGEHIKRVRLLVKRILTQMVEHYPLSIDEIESISSASVLHDIGKIAIPDAILLKPGALTKEEFEIMKTHTIRGCEILESLNYVQDKDYYKYCYEICRHHHERWDGRGYPDKLVGDAIPIWAQVTSIADVYDALTSKRVYKGAYTHEEAVAMILKGECGQFNPKLIDSFEKIKDSLKNMVVHAD